jgi:ferredoxin
MSQCIFIKRGRRMRVVVDLNRCLGYAQCVFLAPSVFKLNGEEALRYDPNPDDAMRQKVLRAAAACPVQAILVEHLTDKEAEATP